MATDRRRADRYFVVPWQTTSHIKTIYDDIFVSVEPAHRERALDTLKTWKYRMSSFYSAGLSATLALVEAEVKALDPKYSPEDLQVWYATAFNRFLNFAHSLTMTQSSMYGAAKELGINSFIVDIRHLCAHGASLPAVENFEICSRACKKWLRLFYWDNLLIEAKDVIASDMNAVAGTAVVSKELEFLLVIYDFTAHLIWQHKKKIGDVNKECIPDSFTQYAKSLESDNLLLIRGQLLKDCSVILESSRCRLDTIHIFCCTMVDKMKHFLEDHVQDKSLDRLGITVVHQNLFHMIANMGIVGEVLRKLLVCSIDSTLDYNVRTGAGFWAGQILKTCSALKRIRAIQRDELKPEELLKLNWDSINTKSLDRTIERAFEAQGLVRENSLIFGVSKKNIWEIKFSREFVMRQLKHTTLASREAHKSLLDFVDPPLSDEACKEFQDLIDSFIDPMVALNNKNKNKRSTEVPMDYEIKDLDEAKVDEDDNDMGIWSCPDEGVTWEKCPIGSHLWHIQA